MESVLKDEIIRLEWSYEKKNGKYKITLKL
jgi:hypothetical protein